MFLMHTELRVPMGFCSAVRLAKGHYYFHHGNAL